MFMFDEIAADEGRWFFEKDLPACFRFTFSETEELGALVIKGKAAFDAVCALIAQDLGWDWEAAGQAEQLAISDRADLAIEERLAIDAPAKSERDHAIDEFITLYRRHADLIDAAGARFDQ